MDWRGEFGKNAFYKLGSNIRGLRKFYGLTQEELALAINITKQAISQYELGDNIPERDILLKICRYFRITENELLNENYSDMKPMENAPIYDKQYVLEMFDKMLPLVCSDAALENVYFKEAYGIHQDLYKVSLFGDGFDETLFYKCLDLYDKAYENDIVEGIANYLWWIMLFGFITILASPKMVKSEELFRQNKIDFRGFIKNGFLHPSDMDTNSEEYKAFENSRIEFLKENEIDILVKIRLLKCSKEYSDLGDYYLAFIYLFNLIKNTKTPEMNSAIGYELMNTYALLGNPYAQKFGSKSKEK